MDAGRTYPERLMLCANRVGKALKNGTLVAVPTGWMPIESLAVGDEVIAGDGSITHVAGVYPQGVKPMLRFTFDVGEEIECCADHLWLHQHPRARYPYRQSRGRSEPNPFYGEWTTASAGEILRRVGPAPIPRMRVVIPTCEVWQLPARAVPLDPYLLGVLLGDGGLIKDPRLSSADPEIIESVKATLPPGARITKMRGDNWDWMIGGTVHGRNPLLAALRDLGLAGCGSGTKFIPDVYRLNSPTVRLAVLRGLMDTDGSISTYGAMEFSSTSARLAADVQFLVHSLGGKCGWSTRQTYCMSKGIRVAGAPSVRLRIRLNLCPFRLFRKARRWNPRRNTPNRIVHRIEPAASAECTCIAVEHPSHTYVAAHGIVTHNTETAAYETTCHMTGLYPHWWTGHRFDHAGEFWLAGKSSKTTRDILQVAMLGDLGRIGTGMVPRHLIAETSAKSGIPDGVETFWVEHVEKEHGAPMLSMAQFRSYDQGRQAFEGVSKDMIVLDEEPPDPGIVSECLLRLMTTHGLLLISFTPLQGLTQVVQDWIENADMQMTDGAMGDAKTGVWGGEK
jgi:phage terminase large subunit-like protein